MSDDSKTKIISLREKRKQNKIAKMKKSPDKLTQLEGEIEFVKVKLLEELDKLYDRNAELEFYIKSIIRILIDNKISVPVGVVMLRPFNHKEEEEDVY